MYVSMSKWYNHDYSEDIYGVVAFDSEQFEAGVTQLHERRNLECNRVTPAESGSLSFTGTIYVPTFIMHAEFNHVTYALF